jgi:hypothetical protein
MDNELFGINMLLRACAPMPDELLALAAGCQLVRVNDGVHGQLAGAPCDEPLDPKGIHPLCCRISGARIRRHNCGAVNVLSQAFAECPGVLVDTGRGHGVRVPGWDEVTTDSQGRAKVVEAYLDTRTEELRSGSVRYWDANVYCPLAPSYRGTAKVGPRPHEADKHNRYRDAGAHGRPLADGKLAAVVISVYGGVGPEGVKELRSLLARHGKPVGAVLPRLAFGVAKFAARTVLQAFGR